jgi:hemerythrin
MLMAKMPDYACHKRAHNQFILTVIENINNFQAGKRFNLFGFTKYLKDWILSHIALVDKQCFGSLSRVNE